MVISTCSSSSSVSSLDDSSVRSSTSAGGSPSTIKFLCSYGGKIFPRYPDGKLRYVGGETRVLAVDRSATFSELLVKMGDLCGWGAEATHLRCQLPTEDLDALISITSDEDLFNLVEEYDLANRDRASPLKIRAFLLSKSLSPPISAASSPPSSVRRKTPFTPPSAYGSSTPSSSYRRISPPSTAKFVPCHNYQRHQQHQHHLGGYGGGVMSPHRHHGGHLPLSTVATTGNSRGSINQPPIPQSLCLAETVGLG